MQQKLVDIKMQRSSSAIPDVNVVSTSRSHHPKRRQTNVNDDMLINTEILNCGLLKTTSTQVEKLDWKLSGKDMQLR